MIAAALLTLAGLILGLYLIADMVVMRGFSIAENDLMITHLGQLQDEIQDSITKIDERNIDWSRWDETYEFVQKPTPKYIELNLQDDNYSKTLRTNFMIFINGEGNIVQSWGFDLQAGKMAKVPPAIHEYILAHPRINRHQYIDSKISGIMLPSGLPPVLFSSRPIITSDGKGPVRGTLVFGLYMNKAEIARIEKKFRTSLKLLPIQGNPASQEVSQAMGSITPANPYYIHPISNDFMSGFTPLKDFSGNPAILLKMSCRRDIHRQGMASLSYLIASLALAGLVFTLVNLLITERAIISRMMALSSSVRNVSSMDAAAGSVTIPGRDEISGLSIDIDRMIGRLKVSQERLREKDEELSSLVDNIDVGVFKISLQDEYRLLEVNRAFARMLGYYSEGELQGVRFQDILFDRDEAEGISSEMESNTRRWSWEVRLRKNDGTPLWVWCKFRSLQEEGAGRMWLDGIAEDITMEKTVKMLLIDKNRELNDFAYTVSHDLKNPLNILKGYLQVIKGDPGLFDRYFEKITAQADFVIGFVDELLKLSRAGQAIGERRKVVLEDLFRQVFVLMKPRDFPAKLDLQSANTVMECDMARIQQVFSNLVGNAIKFRDQKKDALVIRFKAAIEDEEAVLSVEDNGVGIDRENADKIFKAGFSFPRNSGTGFGLAIVRKIVEAHSGTVQAESGGPGQGVRFTLRFPSQDSEREPSGEPPGEPEVPASAPVRTVASKKPCCFRKVIKKHAETLKRG
jgi:PAS domain S-box-containing protein